MSITAALTSAVSGLTVAGRAAQTVSTNIANAMTPGYAARQLDLSSSAYGGVTVTGTTRRETAALIADRRRADADSAGLAARHTALDRVASAVGRAEDADSLSARTERLSASLVEAAGQPGWTVRLQNVLSAATDLAQHLNLAGKAVQEERLAADKAIASGVGALNEGLGRIDRLNRDILRSGALGGDVSGLLDQRRQAVDAISDLVPVREIQRENGSISLMTDNGVMLIGDSPAKVEFTASTAMSANLVLGAPLSGLMVNGREIDMGRVNGGMSGGRLEALFQLRDEELPKAQDQLDVFARDLIERFSQPGLDTSLPAGAAGLFTEGGAPLTSPVAPGLAQRLTVNPGVDPSQGGALYRLRDGIGAAAPGAGGDARLLQALADAMDKPAEPTGTALGGGFSSIGGLADKLVSTATRASYRLSTELSYAEARATTFKHAELAEGVDTDDELRTLMLIEQAYAANARVIEAANAMLDRLMEI